MNAATVAKPEPFRWNAEASVWEFYEEAFGGWTTLRQGTHISTAPMTFEQGLSFVQQRAPHLVNRVVHALENMPVPPDFDLLAEARSLYGSGAHVWSDGAFRIRAGQVILPLLVAEVERLTAQRNTL